ncbi:MAG: hypothetical protein K5705_15170 [Oscillospiraceae bacterium]|nr:hypothetical protein [Oscillospiraceae bacterium]
MKRLFATIVSGAVLLSACSLPSFAEELLTETEITDTTETETEEPAELTLEEQQAAEFEALKERVAEGLRILEERQEECIELEKKQPDEEMNRKRWNDFYAESFDEQNMIPFTLLSDYLIDVQEGRKKTPNFSNKEEYNNEVKAILEGYYTQEIPDYVIAPYLVEIVQQCMSEDDFREMCSEADKFQLCFLNGAIGIYYDPQTGEKVSAELMPERMDVIPVAEISSNLSIVLGNIPDIVWQTTALAFRGITEIAFLLNERNRELMEIELEMARLGVWHVSDDVKTLGDDENENDHANLGQTFNTITPYGIDLYAGDDTYVVPSPEMRSTPLYVTIQEANGNAGENGIGDTVFFEYDVTPDDIELIRSGDDLFINDLVNERYIYIPDEFSANTTNRIENIEFADGTVLHYEDILWRVNYFIGTEEADEYKGYPENCRIFGKGGDDTLTGLSGTNYILGYEGNDTIKAGSLSPVFNDGGAHYLYGMDGHDQLTGGGNTDFLYGGKGDDTMIGGPQDDLFYYALGDGNDTVDETTGTGTYPYDGYDVLWLGGGIKPDEVRVTFSPKDGTYAFVLHIMQNGETVTLPGNMYSGTSPVFPINAIWFEDGTKWTRQNLLELTCSLYGTDEDEEITALVDGDAQFWKEYSGDVTVYGYGGNDTLYGAGGNDTFYGGTGDDYLSGRNGDDTYHYNAGDGDDTIDEQKGQGYYPYGGHDVVIFGEGINPDEVTVVLSLDKYSFTLCFDKVGGSVTMPGNQISGFTNIFPIEEFRFADGTVWNGVQELIDRQVFRGTDGDDVFRDTDDADTIYCGKGNDSIRGTTGDDTYIYEYGDGYDSLTDYSIWGDSDDTLKFGADIKPEEIYAEKLGDYYTLYVRDMSGYVSIYGIENIVFADGTAWKTAELLENAKPADEIRSQVPGDANGDGELTIADIVCLQKYLFGSGILPNYPMADCSGDGIINALDLTLMKRLLLA